MICECGGEFTPSIDGYRAHRRGARHRALSEYYEQQRERTDDTPRLCPGYPLGSCLTMTPNPLCAFCKRTRAAA